MQLPPLHDWNEEVPPRITDTTYSLLLLRIRTHLCPVLRPIVLPLPAVHEPAVVVSVLLAGGGGVVVRGALAVLAPVALARRPRGSGGREGVGVLVG